ncbi:MAG: type I methionyl aminopeptidase [Candidatus Babeliales bacterium]
MIIIKNKLSIQKMHQAGQKLADLFDAIGKHIVPGTTTLQLDSWIEAELKKQGLVSQSKGYKGYRHASCISVNDEVVHGVPGNTTIKQGDLVKVDICASWKGYCADAARCYVVGDVSGDIKKLIEAAQKALDKGIEKAVPGNRLSDISASIQQEVEKHGFGVVRDFAGHGIGKVMHEEPEILNYGQPGKGPVLRAGMTLAIEPMITMGHYAVYVTQDGWTVKTKDKSLAAHVEDTIVITEKGPQVLTRKSNQVGVE